MTGNRRRGLAGPQLSMENDETNVATTNRQCAEKIEPGVWLVFCVKAS
jgi:hypothetical protein